MLSHPITAGIVGLVLGVLSGLGVGGGSLLILWLTLALKMSSTLSRTVNLMFFIPCALTATALRLKSGLVSLKKLLLPTLAGCAAAALFVLIGRKMGTAQLEKLFGVLLIYTGVREVTYRPRKPR